jgi:hypothetical protein
MYRGLPLIPEYRLCPIGPVSGVSGHLSRPGPEVFLARISQFHGMIILRKFQRKSCQVSSKTVDRSAGGILTSRNGADAAGPAG